MCVCICVSVFISLKNSMQNRKSYSEQQQKKWYGLVSCCSAHECCYAEVSIHTVQIAKSRILFCLFFIYSAVFLEVDFCVDDIVFVFPFSLSNICLCLDFSYNWTHFGVFFSVLSQFFSAVFAQPHRMLSSAINGLVVFSFSFFSLG